MTVAPQPWSPCETSCSRRQVEQTSWPPHKRKEWTSLLPGHSPRNQKNAQKDLPSPICATGWRASLKCMNFKEHSGANTVRYPRISGGAGESATPHSQLEKAQHSKYVQHTVLDHENKQLCCRAVGLLTVIPLQQMPAWHAEHFSGLCNVSCNGDSHHDGAIQWSGDRTQRRRHSFSSAKVFHGTDNIVTVPWNGELWKTELMTRAPGRSHIRRTRNREKNSKVDAKATWLQQ